MADRRDTPKADANASQVSPDRGERSMLRKFTGRRDRSLESSQPAPGDVEEASLSLRRAQQGLFGVCADCGAVIDMDQLRIRPQSVRCVRCQEIHETQVHSDPLSSWTGGLAHA